MHLQHRTGGMYGGVSYLATLADAVLAPAPLMPLSPCCRQANKSDAPLLHDDEGEDNETRPKTWSWSKTRSRARSSVTTLTTRHDTTSHGTTSHGTTSHRIALPTFWLWRRIAHFHVLCCPCLSSCSPISLSVHTVHLTAGFVLCEQAAHSHVASPRTLEQDQSSQSSLASEQTSLASLTHDHIASFISIGCRPAHNVKRSPLVNA